MFIDMSLITERSISNADLSEANYCRIETGSFEEGDGWNVKKEFGEGVYYSMCPANCGEFMVSFG